MSELIVRELRLRAYHRVARPIMATEVACIEEVANAEARRAHPRVEPFALLESRQRVQAQNLEL